MQLLSGYLDQGKILEEFENATLSGPMPLYLDQADADFKVFSYKTM